MPVSLSIPTPFRRFTGGEEVFKSSAATLPELLRQLEERYPGLRPHMRGADGKVRSFINIYVNDEDIRFRGGNNYRFQDGDEVMIVPSIAGGACTAWKQ